MEGKLDETHADASRYLPSNQYALDPRHAALSRDLHWLLLTPMHAVLNIPEERVRGNY